MALEENYTHWRLNPNQRKTVGVYKLLFLIMESTGVAFLLHLWVHSNSKQILNHYNAWQLVDSVEKPHLLTGQTVFKTFRFFLNSRLLTVWL